MKPSHPPLKICSISTFWVSADQERIGGRNEIGLQWGGRRGERDALTNWQLCFRAHAEPMGGRRGNRPDPSIVWSEGAIVEKRGTTQERSQIGEWFGTLYSIVHPNRASKVPGHKVIPDVRSTFPGMYCMELHFYYWNCQDTRSPPACKDKIVELILILNLR